MNVKTIKIVIAFLLAIALLGISVAEQRVQALSYCVAWANLPYKSGSLIKGEGGARCTQPIGILRIRVQLRDKYYDPPWTTTENETCYNTDRCEATATRSWVAGHCYDTAVSAWYGIWSSYDQSIEVCFP